MDMVLRLSDQLFVIFFLSFWFLFPIGVFISVAQLDKNTVHEIDLNVVRKEPRLDDAGKAQVKVTLNPTAEAFKPRQHASDSGHSLSQ
jgi:hypothetical protein